MWNRKKSVTLSLIVCFVLSIVLALLLFSGPWLFTHYLTDWRGVDELSVVKGLITVFCACFYPCAVFAAITLYSLISLLFNIKENRIFTDKNVSYLRRICWCCIAVAIITLIGGIFYMPFLFIAAAAGFMGMILRVLKNVMQSAVEIREENDLTI